MEKSFFSTFYGTFCRKSTSMCLKAGILSGAFGKSVLSPGNPGVMRKAGKKLGFTKSGVLLQRTDAAIPSMLAGALLEAREGKPTYRETCCACSESCDVAARPLYESRLRPHDKSGRIRGRYVVRFPRVYTPDRKQGG